MRDRPTVLKTAASTGTQPLPHSIVAVGGVVVNDADWLSALLIYLTARRQFARIQLPLTAQAIPLAGIAQLVEHFTENEGVPSSSLGPGMAPVSMIE